MTLVTFSQSHSVLQIFRLFAFKFSLFRICSSICPTWPIRSTGTSARQTYRWSLSWTTFTTRLPSASWSTALSLANITNGKYLMHRLTPASCSIELDDISPPPPKDIFVFSNIFLLSFRQEVDWEYVHVFKYCCFQKSIFRHQLKTNILCAISPYIIGTSNQPVKMTANHGLHLSFRSVKHEPGLECVSMFTMLEEMTQIFTLAQYCQMCFIGSGVDLCVTLCVCSQIWYDPVWF